jgi:hypothetical protein
MVTALAALVCLSIGVSLEFGGGWALIVDGAVFFIYSLVLAFKRNSQTLLFADNTTTQMRK